MLRSSDQIPGWLFFSCEVCVRRTRPAKGGRPVKLTGTAACRSRKFGGAVAFVCQHQELVLPVPTPSITLGSKGCQHTLAPFLIGRPEPLEIAGSEPPPRDLAASDPDHLRPVGLLRPVGF